MCETPRTLEGDIQDAINRHSAENDSDTPDFILAEYLIGCLAAWNAGVKARQRWYGKDLDEVPAPDTRSDAEQMRYISEL